MPPILHSFSSLAIVATAGSPSVIPVLFVVP
jgi:hypothetical protein